MIRKIWNPACDGYLTDVHYSPEHCNKCLEWAWALGRWALGRLGTWLPGYLVTMTPGRLALSRPTNVKIIFLFHICVDYNVPILSLK